MILVCALLFSCATGSNAASENTDEPLVIDGVADGGVLAENDDASARTGKKQLPGSLLSTVPVYKEWAAKYEFIQQPEFNGIPLISNNSAFDNLPPDIQARKDKAEDFCNQNRFLDAWYAYGPDDNEYIIALKILHMIDCYTDTIMHQIFVLTNLDLDQNLFDYRDSFSQSGEKIFWDPVEVVDTYTKEKCDGVIPHILEMAMGCYFQDAAITFGDEWLVPLEDAYELSVEYFTRAIAAGVYNDYALSVSVDSFLCSGYFTDVLDILHCLELGDSENCYYYYEEAVAYMYGKEYQKSMAAAARAAVLSDNEDKLAASVRVFSDALMYDGRQVEKALAVIDGAKDLILSNYYNDTVFQKLEILLFALVNDFEGRDYKACAFDEMTKAFATYPDDEAYLYELMDYFYGYNILPMGTEWILSILPEWEDRPEAAGGLYFELGQCYLMYDEYQLALDALDKAEEKLTEAGKYDPSISSIPYYKSMCEDQLFVQQKGNSI